MNKANRKLQALIKSGQIDINDFYTLNMWDNEITLQGYKTAENAIKYTPNGQIDSNGFLTQEFAALPIKIVIILT